MTRPSSIGVATLLISSLCIAIPIAGARQNIDGTVIAADRSTPLPRIHVTFLDGTNATLIASAVTDLNGFFDSGDIAAGSYRVRFSDAYGSGSPGFYIPEVYDAEVDDLCRGTLVVVPPDKTITLREDLRLSEPVLIATTYGDLNGTVVDAATRAPLEGIQVSILRADNGEAVPISEGRDVTDVAGFYKIAFRVAGGSAIRMRFSDPRGAFFPEFSGASDLARDEFCAAGVINLVPEMQRTVDALLDRVPPEQSTRNVLDAIERLNVADNLKTVLGTPLLRAVDLLTDQNAANDGGVCGQLAAFMTRVDMEERNGRLSTAEANSLRQSAMNTQDSLGCR